MLLVQLFEVCLEAGSSPHFSQASGNGFSFVNKLSSNCWLKTCSLSSRQHTRGKHHKGMKRQDVHLQDLPNLFSWTQIKLQHINLAAILSASNTRVLQCWLWHYYYKIQMWMTNTLEYTVKCCYVMRKKKYPYCIIFGLTLYSDAKMKFLIAI